MKKWVWVILVLFVALFTWATPQKEAEEVTLEWMQWMYGDDAKIYAWHTDGTSVEGWPKLATLSIKGSPALANLDDDSEQEVVVGDFGGSLHVWNYEGMQQIFLPLIFK